MARQAVRMVCLAALAMVVGGCARPRLASRDMADHERDWSAHIGSSYRAWQPPYLPATREVNGTGATAAWDSPHFGAPPPLPLPPPPPPSAVDMQTPFMIEEIELVPMDGTPLPPRTAPTTYTVRKGDTLSRIAREQLGDAGAAKAIFEYNRDRLASPDKIREGMILKIPPRD